MNSSTLPVIPCGYSASNFHFGKRFGIVAINGREKVFLKSFPGALEYKVFKFYRCKSISGVNCRNSIKD